MREDDGYEDEDEPDTNILHASTFPTARKHVLNFMPLSECHLALAARAAFPKSPSLAALQGP